MISAVIFDFDGVIADTEPLHYRAFQEVLNARDIRYSWEDYVTHYMGFDDRDAFREAFRRADRPLSRDLLRELIRDKARIFNAHARGNHRAPFPGVVELIRELAGRVPLAVCSGGLRSDIDPILESAGLASSFPVIISAEDVETGKPDPAGYRLALRKLSELRQQVLDPRAGWAIEDTPDGIRAARAAGLNTLAVTHSHPPPRLKEADRVVPSLETVDLSKLTNWLEPL